MSIPVENTDSANNFADISRLIQAAIDDPVINKKLLTLLSLDSYNRCSILNNWLEQLRNQHAPERLIHALSILFDDSTASKMTILLRKETKHKRENAG